MAKEIEDKIYAALGLGKDLGRGGFHWPRRGGLKWPHFASVGVCG